MRIVLHGQQAWTIPEKLLERGEDIVAVCCVTKQARRRAGKLRRKNLPVHQPESWLRQKHWH